MTAGYICDAPRRELFAEIDAANVDLKGFGEDFYRRVCGAELAAVLSTLVYLKQETDVWLEITTLLIPGENDSDDELHAMAGWVRGRLGPDVPWHFSAFHPDYRMRDRARTPTRTLSRAREIAKAAGIHHVYTGNVYDPEGQSTWCSGCGARLIERDGYELGAHDLDATGCCRHCGERCPGVFEATPGHWGARRLPVRLSDYRSVPGQPENPSN